MIAEKALVLGLDAPAITALAQILQRHRKDYYVQLQRANLYANVKGRNAKHSRTTDQLNAISGIMPIVDRA